MTVLKAKQLFFMALLSLALVGCAGQQVLNVQSEIVPSNVTSKEEVKKAIVQAGGSLGWRVRELDENTLMATINVRNKHGVEVKIPYSQSEYSILYKTSKNLKYDAEKNTIHKNYNSWINNFNNRIQDNFNITY